MRQSFMTDTAAKTIASARRDRTPLLADVATRLWAPQTYMMTPAEPVHD
jgi:hypothetical protein